MVPIANATKISSKIGAILRMGTPTQPRSVEPGIVALATRQRCAGSSTVNGVVFIFSLALLVAGCAGLVGDLFPTAWRVLAARIRAMPERVSSWDDVVTALIEGQEG